MEWVLYGYGLDSIARSFRSALKAFEDEQVRVESDWEAHKNAVEAGEAEMVDENDESGSYFDYGEYFGELFQEVEWSKRHIREAFLTILYHHWEKKAVELLPINKFEQDKAFAAAKAAAWATDETMIDRLRMLVNCIKHDSAQAEKLNADDPTFFDQAELPYGWYEALRVTDEHVETFIAVVKSSGPPPKWLHNPQEVHL